MNSTAESRLYYFDNLRALAMIAGVFFHAGLAYSAKLHNLWISADRQQSEFVDMFLWFFHIFRMPLFFIIAGFFVALLVNKRGMKAMLWNRTKRIFIPFIVFVPMVMAAIIFDAFKAVGFVQHKSPVLEMFAYGMAHPGTPLPPPSTTHLWFLYNVMMFCVLAWALSYLHWSWVEKIYQKIRAWFFILLLPILLVPALLFGGAPYIAPDSFFPQLWSFGFFGLFFATGIFIFSEKNIVEHLRPYWPGMLILSMVLYAGFYSSLPRQFSFPAVPMSLTQKFLMTVAEAYISVWMSLVCLVLGKTYLNFHNRFMRFISDSSYWIYIVHLPIIFALQYRIMDKDWSLLTKYSATLGVTLALGALSYLLLVRWTPIGWMLNGRR